MKHLLVLSLTLALPALASTTWVGEPSDPGHEACSLELEQRDGTGPQYRVRFQERAGSYYGNTDVNSIVHLQNFTGEENNQAVIEGDQITSQYSFKYDRKHYGHSTHKLNLVNVGSELDSFDYESVSESTGLITMVQEQCPMDERYKACHKEVKRQLSMARRGIPQTTRNKTATLKCLNLRKI